MVQVVLAAGQTAPSLVVAVPAQSGLADEQAPAGVGAVRAPLLHLLLLLLFFSLVSVSGCQPRVLRPVVILVVVFFFVSVVVATLVVLLASLLLGVGVLTVLMVLMSSSVMTAVAGVVVVPHGTCASGNKYTKDFVVCLCTCMHTKATKTPAIWLYSIASK